MDGEDGLGDEGRHRQPTDLGLRYHVTAIAIHGSDMPFMSARVSHIHGQGEF